MEFTGNMLLCGVRVYHAILDFVGYFIPHETQYTSYWKICNPETFHSFNADTREELCFTDDYSILIHCVRRTKGVLEDFRSAIHWPEFCRSGYTVKDLFESVPAPWLFIGYRDGDDTIDCTNIMNQFICSGNYIHVDLLSYIVPEGVNKPWVYINPKTFEETEFPSDGMLIDGEDDDTPEESGDKKND